MPRLSTSSSCASSPRSSAHLVQPSAKYHCSAGSTVPMGTVPWAPSSPHCSGISRKAARGEPMSAARTRRNWTWTAAAFTVAALLAFGGILAPAPGARANAYPDVAGQPAEIQQAIDYVTSRGYMNGGADGGFHPNDPIGRLDYACTLVR